MNEAKKRFNELAEMAAANLLMLTEYIQNAQEKETVDWADVGDMGRLMEMTLRTTETYHCTPDWVREKAQNS